MKESIRQANEKVCLFMQNVVALCIYGESIHDFEGTVYDTVGIVPANCIMQQKLQKVGYVTATAKRDTLLGAADTSLRGHEFHFSTMGADCRGLPLGIPLRRGRKPQSLDGGFATDNVLASYLHLNFAGSDEGGATFCWIYALSIKLKGANYE